MHANSKPKQVVGRTVSYIVMIVIGVIMCYPLIWMFFASFKTKEEIFTSISLLPESYSWEGFVEVGKVLAVTLMPRSFSIHFYW